MQAEIDRLFAAAVDELGHIDVLVNNAGLGGTAEVVDMTDEQWNLVLDVTLTGTFRCHPSRPAATCCGRGSGRDRQQRLGARVAGPGGPGPLRGGQSRGHGADPVHRHRSGAVGGVRVNAVAPSLAMHPFLAKVTSDDLLDELTAREAFGRAAEPWEIANVIVFLASDYSSYMTGEVVSVSSQHA